MDYSTEIIVKSRREAQEIVDKMVELLIKEGSVSVEDFYTMVGIPTHSLDSDYGWTELQGIGLTYKPRDGGYRIDLPMPHLLER